MHRRRVLRLLRAAMVLWAICALAVAPGCSEERDDGTTPQAEALPELTLTDDTGELLLTWIDARGGTHTAVSLEEVPDEGKEMVRVVTKDAGHGSLFYVADLRNKKGDGSYAVRTVRRDEWEAQIEQRRSAYRAKHAPPPPPPTASQGRQPADHGARVGQIQAVVYGAEWCKPCHDAARYLRDKGVAVVERNIEKEPRYAVEMQKKLRDAGMGGGSIPVLDVGGTMLRGYNPRAIDRAIKKARARGTRL